MIVYIGIDDTDNLNTRGTGYRARILGQELKDNGFGEVKGISRHQLFVSPQIPYTSHNSSLCIELETDLFDIKEILTYSQDFLIKNSAEGSDPGLCISTQDKVTEAIIQFGKDAKGCVLTKEKAFEVATNHGIHLSEHGGTGGGVIGALAGVGLRVGGNDGRFVWIKGIRQMQGIYTSADILCQSGVQFITTETGEIPEQCDFIDVGDWFRPVLLKGKPTLLVEKSEDSKVRWKILDRERIKSKY